MQSQVDLDILNLDWISRMVGAHLNLEGLTEEIIEFLKKRIPSFRVKLYYWDNKKKNFFLEDSINGKVRYLNAMAEKEKFLKALELNEPVFLEKRIFIPLIVKKRFIGTVVFESPVSSDRQEVLLITKIIGIVLANAEFFIEYENLNKDLFKFNVLSRALNPTVDEATAVKILTEGIEKVIKFDIYTLLTLGKNNYSLYMKSKAALSSRTILNIKNTIFELIFNLTHKPLDIKLLQERLDIPKPGKSAKKICSCLNAPLITKDKIIGVISLGAFEKNAFSSRDHQNISMLASQGAAALENIMLYKDLQRTYFSIVQALTQAIEAKDPYTRGHSVLVSKYAAAIAAEMGLSAEMIESIQIAGLLHDLGKIGVPEEILSKNSKLTNAEYEVVKSHSEIALKILGSVEFPRFPKQGKSLDVIPELTLSLFEPADLSEDIKLMIFHHHERFSGGGYPAGIKGDKIPLGARILAVADTFEALTADRPYRKAFPLEQARKILQEVSNEQLDPQIVNVFLKILTPKWFKDTKAEMGL